MPSPMVATTMKATKATGIQLSSPTAPLLSRGAPIELGRLALDCLGGPHEVGGKYPRDGVEEQAEEEPGGAEAADAELRHVGRGEVHERQAEHEHEEHRGDAHAQPRLAPHDRP